MTKGLLETLFTGRNLIKTETTASTNNYANELLANNEPIEGTAILAEYQQQGKGQRGNGWVSDYGLNLLVSYIFYPKFLQPKNHFYLNIITSIAVADLVKKNTNAKVTVKWPNDIYCGNNKIAGILIENTVSGHSFTSSVIGIGLNVNQTIFPDFSIKATSLALEKDMILDRNEIFNDLSLILEKYYLMLKEGKYDKLKADYTNLLYRKNEKCNYLINGKIFSGEIISVDDDGKLVMKINEELKKFQFGEIKYVI